jgi:hypothetical protein
MPVATPQNYTIAANWTPTTVAAGFRQAFIDAGIMTDWFSTFINSGVTNCVMRIVYDAGATYGTSFLIWRFAPTAYGVRAASGWDTGTNTATGTLNLDFTSNTWGAYVVGNHDYNFNALLGDSFSTSSSITITRFTSGNVTWFRHTHQNISNTFTIVPSSATLSDVVADNLNIASVPPLLRLDASGQLRASPVVGRCLLASTAGAGSSFNFNQPNGLNPVGALPLGLMFPRTSSVLEFLPTLSQSNQIIVSHSFSPCHFADLTSPDFGIANTGGIITAAPGDTLTLPNGEVWEVLHTNTGTNTNSNTLPLFLARLS